MEYSHDGVGLKGSQRVFVIQNLTLLLLPHVPFIAALLLYLTLRGLLSNVPRQDACTDGPAAACSPSGSFWHGMLFGPLPPPSSLRSL